MKHNLIAKTLGGRLKELRLEHGWLQKDVGDRIGTQQKNYSKYENDLIKRPSPEIIQKLSELYDVPIDVLMRKENTLNHVPPKVLEFIQEPDSVPFLLEAYKKYQVYLKEKGECEDPE